MANIELETLFVAQEKLDQEIANNHQITYANTRSRRSLSLLVEIGELANATRCFKYWSNKSSESQERILDEYADGLHFFLSLGIDIKTNKKSYHFTKHADTLTDQILLVYARINHFIKKMDDNSFQKAFQAFLNLLPLLGYRWKSAAQAYYKKLDENHTRQVNNY